MNMKDNCTSGKWVMHPNKTQDMPGLGYIICQTGRDAKNIASVIPCFGMRPQEILANAKALTASKIMFEALTGFIHAVEHEGCINGRVVDAVRNAEQAIKEATE